jgi:hypothetical protein
MPAIALVPPSVLKDAMIRAGWKLHREDSFNWVLLKDGTPLVIPKRGKLVAREVMESCLIDGLMAPGELVLHIQATGYTF